MGSCGHSLLTRWLEQTDDKVSLASQALMTQKDGPRTLEGCDARLRSDIGGRPRALPSNTAWLTLDNIIAAGLAKRERKKRSLATKSQVLLLKSSFQTLHSVRRLVLAQVLKPNGWRPTSGRVTHSALSGPEARSPNFKLKCGNFFAHLRKNRAAQTMTSKVRNVRPKFR